MKSGKPILLTITLFFVALSIWMKITNFEGGGKITNRTGKLVTSNLKSTDMLIFAAIFFGGYVFLYRLDRQKRS